jgi:hypothetical protein
LHHIARPDFSENEAEGQTFGPQPMGLLNGADSNHSRRSNLHGSTFAAITSAPSRALRQSLVSDEYLGFFNSPPARRAIDVYARDDRVAIFNASLQRRIF